MRVAQLLSSIQKHWFGPWQSWRCFVTKSTCIKLLWLLSRWCQGPLLLTLCLRGTIPRHADPKRMTRILHLQMVHPALTPMLNTVSNSVAETSNLATPDGSDEKNFCSPEAEEALLYGIIGHCCQREVWIGGALSQEHFYLSIGPIYKGCAQ